MMTAEQIIQTICPELSDSPSLSQYIQIARESLSSRFFGKMYEQAVAYKASHLFVLTKPSELNQMTEVSGGSINHFSEGGISIGFDTSNRYSGWVRAPQLSSPAMPICCMLIFSTV